MKNFSPEGWVDFWEDYLRLKALFDEAGAQVTDDQLDYGVFRARKIRSWLESENP